LCNSIQQLVGVRGDGAKPGIRSTAFLVESQRINGSPRQKVICYLGSLDVNDREKLWLRVDFWDSVRSKLDRIELTRRERAKIEESIDLVVSRVPADEAAPFKKEREEYWQKAAEHWCRAEGHIKPQINTLPRHECISPY
jgi:hypothetical protein